MIEYMRHHRAGIGIYNVANLGTVVYGTFG